MSDFLFTIRKAVGSGSTAAVRSALQGRDEATRRTYAEECIQAIKGASKGSSFPTATQCVAALGCCSLSELKALPRFARTNSMDALSVFLDRRPKWSDAWVNSLLEDDHYWVWFVFIRTLVREGVCARPEHPHYVLGMLSGLRWYRTDHRTPIADLLLADPPLIDELWHLFEFEGGGENSLANVDRFSGGITWSDAFLTLMAQGKLDRQRLIDATLAALGRDFNHYRAKWFVDFHHALALTDAERLARSETYLELLHRTTPNVVALAMKEVERIDKRHPISAHILLAALRPRMRASTVGQLKSAVVWIERIVKRDPETLGAAAQAVADGVGHESADAQALAIAWLRGNRHAMSASLVTRLRAHEEVIAPSNRAAFHDLVGDAKPSGRGEDADDSRPASANGEGVPQTDPWRDELSGIDTAWLQRAGLATYVAGVRSPLQLGIAAFDGTDVPRLASADAVDPIRDLTTLVARCASAMEDATRIDEYEAAVDGIARLCGERPKDWERVISPLVARARKRLRGTMPFTGANLSLDLCALVLAWATEEVEEHAEEEEHGHMYLVSRSDPTVRREPRIIRSTISGFVAQRTHAVARRVALRRTLPVLSAPTHRGGLLDAEALATRVQEWLKAGVDADGYDVALALLRLAPDGRKAALDRLAPSEREWVQAIRYALGGEAPVIGRSGQLWTAAACCRAPFAKDEAVAQRHAVGPDAGIPARLTPRLNSWTTTGGGETFRHTTVHVDVAPRGSYPPAPDILPPMFHADAGAPRFVLYTALGPRSESAYRLAATATPVVMTRYFGAAIRILGANLDWDEAQWENKALLEPLLEPDVPCGFIETTLLALALGAKDAGESGLATDIVITAINDGRLDGAHLAEAMGPMLPWGMIKFGRWGRTLSVVAGASPWHAEVVRDAVQRLLAGPGVPPRELMEVLRELCAATGAACSDLALREALGRVPRSGKAGAIARALLALERDAAQEAKHARTALDVAIAGRVERLRRWGKL